MKLLTGRQRRMLAHECATAGCLCPEALAFRDAARQRVSRLTEASRQVESGTPGLAIARCKARDLDDAESNRCQKEAGHAGPHFNEWAEPDTRQNPWEAGGDLSRFDAAPPGESRCEPYGILRAEECRNWQHDVHVMIGRVFGQAAPIHGVKPATAKKWRALAAELERAWEGHKAGIGCGGPNGYQGAISGKSLSNNLARSETLLDQGGVGAGLNGPVPDQSKVGSEALGSVPLEPVEPVPVPKSGLRLTGSAREGF